MICGHRLRDVPVPCSQCDGCTVTRLAPRPDGHVLRFLRLHKSARPVRHYDLEALSPPCRTVEYVPEAEACAVAGVSKATVASWARRGEIRSHEGDGSPGSRRYSLADLIGMTRRAA